MFEPTAPNFPESSGPSSGPSSNVDDGLTSLSWLQNLNMCMTRLGAPTPPTPPASPQRNSNSTSGSSSSSTCSIFSTASSSSSSSSSSCSPNSSLSLSLNRPLYSLHHPVLQQMPDGSFLLPTPHLVTPSGHFPPSRSSENKRPSSSPYAMSNKKNGGNNASSSSNSSAPVQVVEEVINYKMDGSTKPPFSYATLICMAMKDNKNKMTLNSIYKWIRENFLYYQNADPSWQNSIRHNLSLNKCFIKIPRTKDEPGKGGFWRLDPLYAETLVDGVFKKRRPAHRSSGGDPSTGESYKKKSRKKVKGSHHYGSSLDESIAMRDMSSPLMTVTIPFSSENNGIISISPPVQMGGHLSHGPIIEGCIIQEESRSIHGTPTSSSETYAILDPSQCETIELVNAVSSIESRSTLNTTCQYQPFVTGNGQGPSGSQDSGGSIVNYEVVDEVCIQTMPNGSGQCIMNEGNPEICWNAILTDADLEFSNPMNYNCHVVQHHENQCTCDECIVGNLMTNFIQ